MNSRLRLATRIHFALRRRYGESVEVSELLRGTAQGQEALWVCDASGDLELSVWARQLRTLIAPPALPEAEPTAIGNAQARLTTSLPDITASEPEVAPTDMAWSADTSGFGMYSPLVDVELPLEATTKPATKVFSPFRRSAAPRKTT